MDKQWLARWHVQCSRVKDGPFRYVDVAVSLSRRSATLAFTREGGSVRALLLDAIGVGDSDYMEIGQEILAVALHHGLLDHTSEKSIVDADKLGGQDSV